MLCLATTLIIYEGHTRPRRHFVKQFFFNRKPSEMMMHDICRNAVQLFSQVTASLSISLCLRICTYTVYGCSSQALETLRFKDSWRETALGVRESEQREQKRERQEERKKGVRENHRDRDRQRRTEKDRDRQRQR